MASKYDLGAYGGGSARFAPRRGAGEFTYTWDLRPVLKILQAIGFEFGNADPYVRAAHLEMCEEIQGNAGTYLQKAVRARGRVQKWQVGMKSPDARLLEAIESEANRAVGPEGFSVGFLDEIPSVSSYWRIIEFGTHGFMGKILYGRFVNADGKLVHPTKNEGGQIDPKFAQFGERSGPRDAKGQFSTYKGRALEGDLGGGKGSRGRYSTMVTHEIVGYHYMREGIQQFYDHGGSQLVLGTYIELFGENGLDFLARWGRRYAIKRVQPSLIHSSNPFV